ncbi:hypothetical protein BKA70DRAFT_1227585 [Coprinopsis sp. MPI-PUGE-AT-0042]|nr:hypothetical protein BKA70DRAFT_1227585 [Coprinopsis sp. MPI-PUGE-AT-0042]
MATALQPPPRGRQYDILNPYGQPPAPSNPYGHAPGWGLLYPILKRTFKDMATALQSPPRGRQYDIWNPYGQPPAPSNPYECAPGWADPYDQLYSWRHNTSPPVPPPSRFEDETPVPPPRRPASKPNAMKQIKQWMQKKSSTPKTPKKSHVEMQASNRAGSTSRHAQGQRSGVALLLNKGTLDATNASGSDSAIDYNSDVDTLSLESSGLKAPSEYHSPRTPSHSSRTPSSSSHSRQRTRVSEARRPGYASSARAGQHGESPPPSFMPSPLAISEYSLSSIGLSQAPLNFGGGRLTTPPLQHTASPAMSMLMMPSLPSMASPEVGELY